MAKDLTTSAIDRQNILNNRYAVESVQHEIGFAGLLYQNEYRFTMQQVADFYEVELRTIERYVEKYRDELVQNGFQVLRGKELQNFKLWLTKQSATDINVGSKVTQLGLLNFRSFLNLAMLLVESEKARVLRSVILDIVLDTINQRTGGGTKYINQRDEDFVVNYLRGEDYRREFTDALRDYVDMGKAKYPIYTDKIYRSIFKESAQILQVNDRRTTDV